MLLVFRLPRHRDLEPGHSPPPGSKIVQSVPISNHLYIMVRLPIAILLNWFEMAVGLCKDHMNPWELSWFKDLDRIAGSV